MSRKASITSPSSPRGRKRRHRGVVVLAHVAREQRQAFHAACRRCAACAAPTSAASTSATSDRPMRSALDAAAAFDFVAHHGVRPRASPGRTAPSGAWSPGRSPDTARCRRSGRAPSMSCRTRIARRSCIAARRRATRACATCVEQRLLLRRCAASSPARPSCGRCASRAASIVATPSLPGDQVVAHAEGGVDDVEPVAIGHRLDARAAAAASRRAALSSDCARAVLRDLVDDAAPSRRSSRNRPNSAHNWWRMPSVDSAAAHRRDLSLRTRASGRDAVGELLARHRRADQIALRDAAAQFGQHLPVLDGLHAFGHAFPAAACARGRGWLRPPRACAAASARRTTKPWSIFSSVNGICDSCASEE